MDAELKEQKEQKVAEEYLSSLADLNVNSKPLINMLTILAEENIEHASVIVKVVEQHISKVHPDIKLPILYLIDSIVKNVKSTYISLFSQCIVNIFCGVFEQVNEKVRERMYTLRQTWNEVFAAQKLYTLDVKVNCMDRNWPITAKVTKSPSIHVNPNFFKKNEMEATLRVKTRELLELEKRKLELELEATKKLLQEQEKQLTKQTESVKNTSEAPPIRHTPVITLQGTAQTARGGPIYQNYPSSTLLRQSQTNSVNTNNIQTYPTVTSAQHTQQQKCKVHPVNSSLLSAVRHRDPRLMRQQQKNSQDKSALSNPDINKLKTNTTSVTDSNAQVLVQTPSLNQNSVFQGLNSYKKAKLFDNRSSKNRENDVSTRDRVLREDRPLKQRHEEDDSGPRMKSLATASRTKRCANRSRSESKSPIRNKSSTRSNRSGSSIREKNKRLHSNKMQGDKKNVNKSIDQKYITTFPKIIEVNINKEVEKKKSSSPLLSPIKHKESKTKMMLTKSLKNYATRKHKSRSPSPDIVRDTDLRVMRPEKRTKSSNILSKKGIFSEKEILITPPPPLLDSKKCEFEESVSTGIISPFNLTNADIKPLTGDMTSKKIDQNLDSIQSVRDVDLRTFQTSASNAHQTAITSTVAQSINVLEKSAEPTMCSNVSSKTDIKISSDNGDIMQAGIDCQKESLPAKQAGEKKRLSSDISIEPMAKRSKSGKIDGLFGTEDVDLRTSMPTVILKKGADMTPPPPPMISNENESWARVKLQGVATKISPTKPNLDDVRAKLAKAAKFNKLEFMQKSKIFELQDESASQECNDSKIRTIISQAQELLENKSINEEQYNNLVKTVIQINETNKLNAAKRLESLNSIENMPDIESIDTEQKAREAIHKKRIPKISKEQQNSENFIDNKELERLAINRIINKVEDNSKPAAEKEKRNKVSKWSSSTSTLNIIHSSAVQQQSQKNRFGNGLTHIGRPFSHRSPMPSPWQNPHNLCNTQSQSQSPTSALSGSTQLPTITVPKPCNSVDNPQADVVRTITIDGRTKEIRFYGDVAIVFMDWDQPREIGFQPGTRKITLDNKESIVLNFNEDYKEVTIDGESHRMRFAFPSRELYIDEHWYEVYFGGPAMPIPIQNKIHMLQAEGPPPQVHIGILRRDLVAGKINMIVDARNIIPVFLDADPQTFMLDGKQHVIEFTDNLRTVVINDEPLQVVYGGLPKSIILSGRKYFIRFGALPAGITPGQHIIKGMRYIKMQPSTTEKLLSDSNALLPLVADAHSNLNVSPENPEETASVPPVTTAPNIMSNSVQVLPNVNIDELFQKLISTGIINTLSNSTNKDNNQSTSNNLLESTIVKEPEPIKPINLNITDSIKTRQTLIINTLFCGMQCSSCGVRFPPEQTIKYSQHLDWHFRQNRRERDSSRKAHSRKWYYEVSDWLQYEEIEDFDDREKIFFESQQIDIERTDENSNQRATNSPALSCPAEPGDVDRACDMCQEKFEQYYNEELEEWHLRAAIRLGEKIYHPLCFEDYKSSLHSSKENTKAVSEDKQNEVVSADDDNAVDTTIVKVENVKDDKPDISVIHDDDDDDVIVVPLEEPTITEIEDDEEYVPINLDQSKSSDSNNINEASFCEAMESDVEIQEPNIPFTDLDTYVENNFKLDDKSEKPSAEIKIKEEPKEDDEYDDFEDVGTVLIAEDNVSVLSSEDNVGSQSVSTLQSSIPASPIKLDMLEDTSQPSYFQSEGSTAPVIYETPETINSMDGNLESFDNPLSATTSLVGVNKIKINMTKNIVSSNNSTPTTKLNSLNPIEHKQNTSGNVSNISTIPVLCSGATTASVSSASPQITLGDNSSTFSGRSTFSTTSLPCTPILSPSNGSSSVGISNKSNVIQVITSQSVIGASNKDNTSNNIPVIGGSGSNSSSINSKGETLATISPIESRKKSIEERDEPSFTFKVALQNVQLKKMLKVERGIEASGLCSIM